MMLVRRFHNLSGQPKRQEAAEQPSTRAEHQNHRRLGGGVLAAQKTGKQGASPPTLALPKRLAADVLSKLAGRGGAAKQANVFEPEAPTRGRKNLGLPQATEALLVSNASSRSPKPLAPASVDAKQTTGGRSVAHALKQLAPRLPKLGRRPKPRPKNLRSPDVAIFLPARITGENRLPMQHLRRLGGGRPPMLLRTSHQQYLTVATGLRGGFGEILLAIDQQGNLKGIKQMRSEAAVAAMEQNGEEVLVRPTPLARAQLETNLTQHLAPGLNVQNLIEDQIGRTYMVMDFMPVAALDAFVAAPHQHQSEIARLLLLGAAQKLQHIHAMGYTHRDVKFENILVGPAGGVEICDFGLAVIKAPANRLVGTFMCPEVFQRGGKQTAASDVYSLCASVVDAFSQKRDRGPLHIGKAGAHKLNPMFDNQKALEDYRQSELSGKVLPARAKPIAERFANLKAQDSALHKLIVARGMHPDPALRMTTGELVIALTSELGFDPTHQQRAKTRMLNTMQSPGNIDEQQIAIDRMYQLDQM